MSFLTNDGNNLSQTKSCSNIQMSSFTTLKDTFFQKEQQNQHTNVFRIAVLSTFSKVYTSIVLVYILIINDKILLCVID